MTSFAAGSKEVMALQADYIDSGLNTFLGKVINLYSRFGWTMDKPVSCLEFDIPLILIIAIVRIRML